MAWPAGLCLEERRGGKTNVRAGDELPAALNPARVVLTLNPDPLYSSLPLLAPGDGQTRSVIVPG